MAGEPQLQRGSEGEWVEYLQQSLEYQGIDTGPIDGIFGPITDRAVREYQEREGLTVDGIVGPITWGALTGGNTEDDSDDEGDDDRDDAGGGGGAGGGDAGDEGGEGGTTRESVTVEHTLTYVEQTDDETCWAASTAMMLGRTDDREIVREVMGDDPSDDENDGISEVELARVANHYGFSQVYPVCQDAFGWADWLAEGPLLIQVPGQTHHSVVAAGVYASADEEVEESLLLIYDPWPGNGVRWLPFNEANNDYELAGDWSNNVYRQ